MSVSSVPNCLSVRYLNPRCRTSSPFTSSIKKKVACVINASTTTSFMGDFISDKIQEPDAISIGRSTDSPIFYHSSSSNNETIFKNQSHHDKNENLTYSSLNESMKIENINATSSNTSDYLLSIKTNPLHSTVISSSTVTDTFGYLFALDRSNKSFKASGDETQQGLTVPHAKDFSKRFHANILLSSSSKPVKKVNFKSQGIKNKGDGAENERLPITKPLLNRQVISFVYPNKSTKSKVNVEKVSFKGDKDQTKKTQIILDIDKVNIENEQTDKEEFETECNKRRQLFPNFMSMVSDRSNLFDELLNETCLPSTAEGDTIDNHSDMIKVYPRFVNSQPSQQQLFTHLHTTDTIQTPSYSYLTNEITKSRCNQPAERLKSQKIFSQLHHRFPRVKTISKKCKTQSEIKNHSIETMKFFHSTLALKEF